MSFCWHQAIGACPFPGRNAKGNSWSYDNFLTTWLSYYSLLMCCKVYVILLSYVAVRSRLTYWITFFQEKLPAKNPFQEKSRMTQLMPAVLPARCRGKHGASQGRERAHLATRALASGTGRRTPANTGLDINRIQITEIRTAIVAKFWAIIIQPLFVLFRYCLCNYIIYMLLYIFWYILIHFRINPIKFDIKSYKIT